MQAAIEGCGFATLNLGYASRRKALEQLAERHPSGHRSFAAGIEGSIHFVGHSMGGLLARAYLGKYRPKRLGRVVMLGTPNGGSEIADRLKNVKAYRAWFGPAGQQLITQRDAALDAILPPVDYPVGIIAGTGRSTRYRRHCCRSRMTGGYRLRTPGSSAWLTML